MFNVDTELYKKDVNIPDFLYFDLTQWVSHDTATTEERKKFKVEIETCGGFLKTLEYKEAFKRAWGSTSKSERELMRNLPNFDADVFYEISGIKV